MVTDLHSRSAENPTREMKKERDADSKQRPRLDIPKKNSHQGHNKHREVEKIFEKMTVLKTPVSAIQTPIKAEVPKFQFNEPSHSHKTSGGQQTIPRKKLVDAIDEDAEKNQEDEGEGKGSSLRNDLRLSDESDIDTEEPNDQNLNSSNETCEEVTPSSSSRRTTSPMKRVTDSESSGSESDANTSESESESDSEADTPPPSPPKKKSYSLMTQICKLRQEVSQMAPSTPSIRNPPSVENPPSNSRLDIKNIDMGAECSDNDNDENDSFSKYNDSQPPSFKDFHQPVESPNSGKASPSVSKTKGSSKVATKPSASSKPTVKRPQPRTDNSSSSKASKGGSAAPRTKSESSSKDSAKGKTSKQSSKSVSQNKKSPGPGGGKSKSQEKKPSQRAKPNEKKKQPKSSPFVDTDDSDSEDERTRSRPPKAAINTSTSSSSSSSSSSIADTSDSLAQQPKQKPDSGKRMPGTKKGDNKYIVKPEPPPVVETFDYHRPPYDDFAHMDPILSPIRADFNDERHSSSSFSTMDLHPSEIKYDKDGKASLFVRLRRDLFDHLPKSNVFKFEPNVPGPSTQRRKDSTDPPEKPSAIVKPVKRKQTELEKEKSGRPENKRSRIDNKSPRRMREDPMRDEPTEPLEPFVQSESSLDRRQSSDRRSGVSGMSSQQSSHSSRGRKNERDPHHPSGRSKRDTSRGRDPTGQRIHDWTSPERHADRQFTADDYLAEGKKLKRLADTQVDKHAKALTYFEAVLYLTSCGNAFELDPHVADEKAVTMYSDTCEIIRFILKLKGIHNGQEGNSNDNKLAVLCYRSQALLNMHMFKLKRRSAMKLSQALSEHLKGSSSKPQPPLQQNPSPWSASARYTGTPSPISPTPSPAGSVGSACSLGSQGSTSSDLVPSSQVSSGPNAPSSGPGSKLCNGLNPQSTVAVPQRIVSIMSTFLTYSNYSLYSIYYWEQADTLTQENLDFFLELDRECGDLTLHSSTQELVHYVRRGLSKLRRL